MRDALLNALARAVSMHRGAYTFEEAVTTAAIEYGLDEFETEDLEVITRNQLARLELQTGSKKA